MTTNLTPPEARIDELLDLLLSANDPHGDRFEFMGAQFDLGLAWVHFPEGQGGLGLSRHLQKRIDERLDEVTPHRPSSFHVIGHGMGAPMLLTHGTEEQKARYLRPLFTGEEVWCQLFSEPGAGSDVAGLATRAVRDGDEWVLNGQKVWTTVAHVSKWGMVVARTDPDAPKHLGMTYFLMDMEAEGVEISDDEADAFRQSMATVFGAARLAPHRRRRRRVASGAHYADERAGRHRRHRLTAQQRPHR